MSAVDELCGFGFERYWVQQALELTNRNKDYALEWLLSDEFKLARQQFNEAKAKFKAKQTDSGDADVVVDAVAVISNSHHKEPSLQGMPFSGDSLPHCIEPNVSELEMEYDLNRPDLRPRHNLRDANVLGIDHLLGSSSDDDDAGNLNAAKSPSRSAAVPSNEVLLAPQCGLNAMDRRSSAYIEPEDDSVSAEKDDEMAAFLEKLKCQVFWWRH